MDSLNDTTWVTTRADLVSCIRQLGQEAQAPSRGWENRSLDRYLEALSAWTNDMDSYFINRGEPVPESPDWGLIAVMLRAACFYE
ncbi:MULTISPECIES: hypothetical protein [unclassified Streptomyces]|uniref:DUF7660 family protein n=1 Tax=unclassified Streptomyces TaxID=2593676 RepID=UPI002258A38D|nr:MULTISPECIES: hypothetical protein [unclassified Streptomyces]WTB61002.1 hypothetical protein OG832_49310 [Streptomyces sp. NBC_00826]WTH96142.1 hypothetical protein OIC43_44840 [Streptomyces sp. NBC_00825]WTI04835.1 hypothetical protein OHA23_44800 [Streptomyces sp. NBC_00822]MCX4870529.1 hypothetical protein [Streptomyces sp. NBC_00906]MCX4901994.1 hypothetical protein [Streptomyces sp. NBC_00892]